MRTGFFNIKGTGATLFPYLSDFKQELNIQSERCKENKTG